MSILVKEDYANPLIPLWAKAGNGIPVLLNSNGVPQAFSKMFDVTPPDNVLNIMSYTVNQPKSGKILVTLNWILDSGGQDALMITALSGTIYAPNNISINAGKGIFGVSHCYTIPYTANTICIVGQQLILDPLQSPVFVEGTASWSIVFYPNS